MPSIEELKAIICKTIDENSEAIIGVAKKVLDNPEPGFREVKTAKIVADKFSKLGLNYRDKLGLTGVKTVVNGGNGEGPTVGVLGELDSLIVPDHPHADPVTGAAHACGHHCQIAMMLGVATGLVKSGVLPSLSGKIALMAVPAEEYIEIEFREQLRRDGKLSYLGGKPELIKLGEFDDIDLAFMTHTTSEPDVNLALGGTNNGIVAKQIQFIGKSAHAGAAPHEGINALNAAMLALSAIHAQRETFREEDTIRIHPIITKGGVAVNAVPADVRMETFVRGKTLDAITGANEKVDRCLRAGAMAMGAKVKITTLPGYMPLEPNQALQKMYRENAASIIGNDNVSQRGHSTGSTDMGDVSLLMPAIHSYAGGATGIGHGNNYVVKDYQMAVINPAKTMAMMVIDLLSGDAVKAKGILTGYKPRLTQKEYLDYMDSIVKEEIFPA